MSDYMDEFIDLIRMEAADVVARRQFDGTLIATSYDPKTHMVRGIIMPHEVESGWVRIGVAHSGNDYGILAGPKVGTKEDLNGDQFNLQFEDGNPNNLVATHKQFDQQSKPPEVQSGEILFKQAMGSSTHYKADGSVVHTHGPSGATITWDADGNYTHDNKAKAIVVKTDGAYTQQTPNGNLA